MQTEARTSAFYESLNKSTSLEVYAALASKYLRGTTAGQDGFVTNARSRAKTVLFGGGCEDASVLSVCIAPFTLLHALSLGCAAEAELSLLKSRLSLKHRQSYGDRDLTWVSSPQNELQKI